MIRQMAEDLLYKQIFDEGKFMISPEIDSIDFHAMSHEDTEILGQFCDFTNIHGETLRTILIKGYLQNIRDNREGADEND